MDQFSSTACRESHKKNRDKDYMIYCKIGVFQGCSLKFIHIFGLGSEGKFDNFGSHNIWPFSHKHIWWFQLYHGDGQINDSMGDSNMAWLPIIGGFNPCDLP